MKRAFWAQAVGLALAISLAACLRVGRSPKTPTTMSQEPGPSLKGVVTDPAGSAVPEAQVVAINETTGQSYKTRVSPSGQFFYPALPKGRYTLTVIRSGFSTWQEKNIDVPANKSLSLQIQLAVGASPPAPSASCTVCSTVSKRISARHFLVGWRPERRGFGLYSYLLLKRASNDEARRRNLAVIEAFLCGMQDVSEYGGHYPRGKLNVTYILVSEKPPKQLLRHGCKLAAADARWVSDHYEFARAQVLLNLLRDTDGAGPYTISSPSPLLEEQNALPQNQQYFFQDMSEVPPDLAGMWERYFVTQTREPDFWQQDGGREFVLHLRTYVEVAAQGLPDVLKSANEVAASVGQWIKLL